MSLPVWNSCRDPSEVQGVRQTRACASGKPARHYVRTKIVVYRSFIASKKRPSITKCLTMPKRILVSCQSVPKKMIGKRWKFLCGKCDF